MKIRSVTLREARLHVIHPFIGVLGRWTVRGRLNAPEDAIRATIVNGSIQLEFEFEDMWYTGLAYIAEPQRDDETFLFIGTGELTYL